MVSARRLGYEAVSAEKYIYIGYPVEPYEGTVMYLPAGMTEVEEQAFLGTAVQTAVINDGCVSLGDLAFALCPNLQYVVVPDSVTEFGQEVFSGSPVILICSEDSAADAYASAWGIPVRRP